MTTIIILDPLLEEIRKARVRQNQIVGTFIDLWLAASERQHAQLGYSVVSPSGGDDYICGPDGKVIGEFRITTGNCVVHWLRSYDDLRQLDDAVDELLKEDI